MPTLQSGGVLDVKHTNNALKHVDAHISTLAGLCHQLQQAEILLKAQSLFKEAECEALPCCQCIDKHIVGLAKAAKQREAARSFKRSVYRTAGVLAGAGQSVLASGKIGEDRTSAFTS